MDILDKLQQKKTLRAIIWQKVITHIERATLWQTVRFFSQLFGAVCVTILLVYPSLLLDATWLVFSASNFALPKFTLVFTLLRYRKHIQRILKRFKNKQSSYTVEGIPAVELLDHLFTAESFKRDDVIRKFGIPHHRYQALAKKLESLEVLVRGEKNARVLNPAFSRQDIAAILHNKRKARDLEEVLKPIGKGSEYTTEPTAERIRANVEEELEAPLPVFTLRRV